MFEIDRTMQGRTSAPDAFLDFERSFAIEADDARFVQAGDLGVTLIAKNLAVLLPDGTLVTAPGDVSFVDGSLVQRSDMVRFVDGVKVYRSTVFDGSDQVLVDGAAERRLEADEVLSRAKSARAAAGFARFALRDHSVDLRFLDPDRLTEEQLEVIRRRRDPA
jgi:hypothetical protein